MNAKQFLIAAMGLVCSGHALAEGLDSRLHAVPAIALSSAQMENVQARYISDDLAALLLSLPQASYPAVQAAHTNVWDNSVYIDFVFVHSISDATDISHSADGGLFNHLNPILDQMPMPLGPDVLAPQP